MSTTPKTKPPASVEIPPALRARIETAVRAAIPDATGVRMSITRRKTGYGARTTPWVLVIAADHPPQGSYGSTSVLIAGSTGLGGGNVYETAEKALAAAEVERLRWLLAVQQ